mmetsp:Transcript_25613/g.59182  ORF Transcript_25613/g.59182 Transcript_25613/m.59182 type:complete len:215 (-) Transcript_25613:79-723(-)
MSVQLFETEAVKYHQAKFPSARVCYNADAGYLNLVPRGKQRGFPVVEGLRTTTGPFVVAKGNACHVGDSVIIHFAAPAQAIAFEATLKNSNISVADTEDAEPEDIGAFIDEILAMTPERYAPVAHVKDDKEAAHLAYLLTGEVAVEPEVAPAMELVPAPATPPASKQVQEEEQCPGTPPRRRTRQLVEATPPRVKRVRPSEVAPEVAALAQKKV